jgi:hypothetical protein
MPKGRLSHNGRRRTNPDTSSRRMCGICSPKRFRFLGLHLLEDFRRGRKFGAQAIGKIAEDARILFFKRDGEG